MIIGTLFAAAIMAISTNATSLSSTNRLGLIYPGRAADPYFKPGPGQSMPAIIAPHGLQPAAQSLADALRPSTGGTIPVVEDTAAVRGYGLGLKDEWNARSLIILGNLEQNQAVFQLYARFLTDADARNPGPGGYLIQFIPNLDVPGRQVLLVAGSTEDDTRQAVRHLVEQIAALSPGPVDLGQLECLSLPGSPPKPSSPSAAATEKAAAPAVAFLLQAAQPGAADYHYNMGAPSKAWDALARRGTLNSNLVSRVDQALLDYLVRWEDAWWRRKENAPGTFVKNRHHVYGTWGYREIARTLYVGLTPAQRDTPAGHYVTDRVRECEQWLTACAMQYEPDGMSDMEFVNCTCFLLAAAQTGRMEPFESGKVRRLADWCAAGIDNLGQSVGIACYEDTYFGRWSAGAKTGAAIPLAAFYYRDPVLRQMVSNLPPGCFDAWWGLSQSNHLYACAEPGAASPGEAPRGNLLRQSGYEGQEPRGIFAKPCEAKDAIPPCGKPQGFLAKKGKLSGILPVLGDKQHARFLCLRAGNDPENLFLLLTGAEEAYAQLGEFGMNAYQTYPNMIARLSWRKKAWLITNTNHETPYHRNALTVDSTWGSERIEDLLMRIGGCAQTGGVLLASVTARYAQSDWTRSLAAVDDEFLVVEDSVEALKDGIFSAIATWRSPYPGAVVAQNMVRLRANDRFLSVVAPENQPAIITQAGWAPENEGAVRPFVIRHHLRGSLRKGEALSLTCLLYPGAAEKPTRFAIRRVAPRASLVRDETRNVFFLVGFQPCTNAGLEIGAASFVLSSTGRLVASAVGATVRVDGRSIPAGELARVVAPRFEALWKSLSGTTTPDQSVSSLPEAKPRVLWRFDDFSPVSGRLRDYTQSISTSGVDFSEHTIRMDAPTLVDSVRVWYRQDGHGMAWRTNHPVDLQPIQIWNDDVTPPVPLPIQCSVDFRQGEEMLKGCPTTFIGVRARLDATVRQIRLRIPVAAPYGIELLGKPAEVPEILDAVVCSLSKPGESNILVRTSEQEIVCLDAQTARCLWRARLPVIVTAWVIADADGDGVDEIGLACMDATTRRLDARDGRELWRCDIGDVSLPLPYDIAVLRSTARGHCGFIVSSYYHMAAVDLDGHYSNPKSKIVPGMWVYNILGGIDLNRDGYGDAISRALWGQVNLFDGKTGKVDYFGNRAGRLVKWRLMPDTDDGKPDLLILATGGLGRYHADIRASLLHAGFDGAPDEDGLLAEPRSQRTIWAHSWQAKAVDMVEWNGEIIVGHASGILTRFSPQGVVLGRLSAEIPLIGLAVVRDRDGRERLAVNNGQGVTFYDKTWQPVSRIALPNTGIRVFRGGPRIVALFPGGGVGVIEAD